jgi:hypothetical protein
VLGCFGVLSLVARRAVRYAFPAFGFCQVGGAHALAERMPQLRTWIGEHPQLLEAALAAWLSVAVALRVAT